MQVENDDEPCKVVSKPKTRRPSTVITPKAKALQTHKGGPKDWYDHLNAKRYTYIDACNCISPCTHTHARTHTPYVTVE